MNKEVKPLRPPVPHGAGGPVRLKGVTPIQEDSPDRSPAGKLDDEDYPAYSMGHAAEILGVTQAFLRSLDAAKLLTPGRSEGGHRRYSRYQLRIAARARELIDQGTALDSACRIIILEDQLAEARRINTELQHTHRPQAYGPTLG
ncbi:helix-turn-helix domain-containing protein [Rhodococcus opacus]|uniref:helix-turn-helix domain-containing protein n=1 Tax=Rhodococcus opacus TaxID=37919 RepID=UPI002235EFB9|nr:helix-turn-helix domain-containing protein [Rhodococcus opacus]UZG55234.1 helix-turn-helix domain-containing protein [Rhodococcus opacus]